MYTPKGGKNISESLEEIDFNEYYIDKSFFHDDSSKYYGESMEDGIDYQGVPWKKLFSNISRKLFRKRRNKSHIPYRSISQPPLIHYPPNMRYINDSIYSFQRFYKLNETFIGHFQLRHNLITANNHDLLFTVENGFGHYSTIDFQCKTYKVSNEIRPTSISKFENIVALSGLKGELILYDLNELKVINNSEITEEQAINNHILLYEDNISKLKVLTCSNDQKVRINDINNIKDPVMVINFENAVNFASLSKNKDMLLVLTDDVNSHIVDMKTGKTINKLKGHLDYSFAGDWSHNGYHIATGSQDTTCRVWDIRNVSKELHILQSEIGCVLNVKYAKDGDYLIFAENMDFVSIYDVKTNYEYYQQIDCFGEIGGMNLDMISEDKLYFFIHIKDYGGIFEFKLNQKSLIEDLEDALL